MKNTTAAIACLVFTAQGVGFAAARDFKENSPGAIDFNMPSLKICCSYVGTAGKIPSITCSRTDVKNSSAKLDASGNLAVGLDAGVAPACVSATPMGNVLQQGDSWKKSEFTCNAEKEGLSCVMGRKGFTLTRSGVKSWP